MKTTRVLYIAGAGRSGSTLLGCILGQLPGFCFVGETMYRGVSLASQLCGCGVRVADCSFWNAVWKRATGTDSPIDEREFFGLARRARWRYLPYAYVPGGDRRLASRYGADWQACSRLYAAVADESGARVIVDSSKVVPYGRALAVLPDIDLRVVHLVRDPRAAAYSWKRAKIAPDRTTGYMKRLERGRATWFWIVNNLGAELLCRHAPDRYLRLRYEDFVARPRDVLARILRLAGDATLDAAPTEPGSSPFIGDDVVMLRPTHNVWGNPDRFRTGVVELRPDEEWRVGMPRSDRCFVAGVAWPFLVRYGYPTLLAH